MFPALNIYSYNIPGLILTTFPGLVMRASSHVERLEPICAK